MKPRLPAWWILLFLPWVDPVRSTGAPDPAIARLVRQPASSASFVLDAEGRLWAWGENEAGELADGTLVRRARPKAVPFPAGVIRWQSISAGSRVLALDQAGRLWGWGAVGYVRTGWAIQRQPKPTLISGPTNRWRSVASAATGNVDVTVDDGGHAFVWRFPRLQVPSLTAPFATYRAEPITPPAGAARWVSAIAGRQHALLLSDSGQVFFLGVNVTGTAGPGGLETAAEQFVEVPAPKVNRRWVAVAAGADQSFAQLSDGEWYFWGAVPSFIDGRSVIRSQPDPAVLKRPDGVTTWRRVVGGESFALLLSDAGRVFGLGDNSLGQLAYPRGHEWDASFADLPRRVFPVGPIAQDVRDISAGLHHALVLGEDGLLYTWGANDVGQLGRAANGSDWRPATVRGEAAPFSPEAPPFPLLAWHAIEPTLIAPMLAGASGQAARFELQRPDTNRIRIPVRLELTSPHSLPGLPFNRVELVADGVTQGSLNQQVQLQLTASSTQVALVPGFGLGAGVAASLGLRAAVPPWVEWEGADTTPLNLGFPGPLSFPPTGSVQLDPTADRWIVGDTNVVSATVSDPDGFVTAVELYAVCNPFPCNTPELIGRRTFTRGIPRISRQLAFPWVPADPRPGETVGLVDPANYGFPGSPRRSVFRQFTLVLHDNAGSIITNHSPVIEVVLPDRFRLTLMDAPRVVEAPATLRVRLEELRPGSTVTRARLVLTNSSVSEVKDVRLLGSLPTEAEFSLVSAGTVQAMALIQTADGAETILRSASVKVATGATLPTVIIEATDSDANEEGLKPGEVRLTRFGGSVAESLAVRLAAGVPAVGAVPPPRLRAVIAAIEDVDFRRIPPRVVFAAGVRSITVPVVPLPDAEVEGNEGMTVVLKADLSSYETLPGLSSALVLIHDRQTNSPTSVELDVPVGDGRHSALQPLTVRVSGTNSVVGIEKLELVADGLVFGEVELYYGSTLTLFPPLPLGSLTLRARATDRLGGVAESAPVTLEIIPELRLSQRRPEPDGSELWRVSLQPDFTDLQLESSDDLDEWRPVGVFRPNPLFRVFEVPFAPDRPARFLRVVPAP